MKFKTVNRNNHPPTEKLRKVRELFHATGCEITGKYPLQLFKRMPIYRLFTVPLWWATRNVATVRIASDEPSPYAHFPLSDEMPEYPTPDKRDYDVEITFYDEGARTFAVRLATELEFTAQANVTLVFDENPTAYCREPSRSLMPPLLMRY